MGKQPENSYVDAADLEIYEAIKESDFEMEPHEDGLKVAEQMADKYFTWVDDEGKVVEPPK